MEMRMPCQFTEILHTKLYLSLINHYVSIYKNTSIITILVVSMAWYKSRSVRESH